MNVFSRVPILKYQNKVSTVIEQTFPFKHLNKFNLTDIGYEGLVLDSFQLLAFLPQPPKNDAHFKSGQK